MKTCKTHRKESMINLKNKRKRCKRQNYKIYMYTPST